MSSKKGFNKYEIRGKSTVMFFKNRKGQEFESLIDTDDLDRLIKLDWHWNIEWANYGTDASKCYIRTSTYLGYKDGKPKYKTYKLHRVIMNAKFKETIDHINHDTLDNRKGNLRVVEVKDNTKNRSHSNSNNTSGYRNVSKIGKEWCVQLQIEGKNTCLKKFSLDQLDQAGLYASEMRDIYYGKFAGNN